MYVLLPRTLDEGQARFYNTSALAENMCLQQSVLSHTSCTVREFEAWALSVAEAKERAAELASARDSSEQKMAEEQLSHERAYQHIQRVELFRQQKIDMMEHDEVNDSETIILGHERNLEVEVARDVCQKLVDKLLLLRRSMVKIMQTELLRREQLETFETQYRKLELGLRDAGRLKRTYAREGAAGGAVRDVTVQESRDADALVAKQQVQLGTYQSVLKERREMWGLAVSHVQKLKIATRRKESDIRTALHELREYISALKKSARQRRAKNEGMFTLKTNVEHKTKTLQTRAKLLRQEQLLLKAHSGPFFDTNVWQQGVPQRMSTARFNEDLQVRPLVAF